MNSKKSKRVDLNLNSKQKIIEYHRNNHGASQRTLASMFKVSVGPINRILKNSRFIMHSGSSDLKRTRKLSKTIEKKN
jgi:hypothetical protein